MHSSIYHQALRLNISNMQILFHALHIFVRIADLNKPFTRFYRVNNRFFFRGALSADDTGRLTGSCVCQSSKIFTVLGSSSLLRGKSETVRYMCDERRSKAKPSRVRSLPRARPFQRLGSSFFVMCALFYKQYFFGRGSDVAYIFKNNIDCDILR